MNPHIKHRLTADRRAILLFIAGQPMDVPVTGSMIAEHFCISRARAHQQLVHLRAAQFITPDNELLQKGWLEVKKEQLNG